MQIREYCLMHEREATYWWFVNKRLLLGAAIRRYLGEDKKAVKILDIGCGTGALLDDLEEYGKVYGLDKSLEALGFCRERMIDNLLQGDSAKLPFKDNAFDVVIAADLLEHVPDDAAVVKECHRVIRKNGFLISTVPAFMSLWSRHDLALGHRRRYRLKDLKRIFTESNFQVKKVSYYIFLLFLPVFIFRFLGRIFRRQKAVSDFLPLPRPVNEGLIYFLGLERMLISWINFPFGVSLLLVGKKI